MLWIHVRKNFAQDEILLAHRELKTYKPSFILAQLVFLQINGWKNIRYLYTCITMSV